MCSRCRWGELAEPSDEYWLPEPIIAHRLYSVTNGRLYPLNLQFRDPYEKDRQAYCLVADGMRSHLSPGFGCSCGYYSSKSAEWLTQFHEINRVYAKVALTGRVVEHEGGYRSQYQEILEIDPRGSYVTDIRLRELVVPRYPEPLSG